MTNEEKRTVASIAISEYFADMYQLLSMYVPKDRLIGHHNFVQTEVPNRIAKLLPGEFSID